MIAYDFHNHILVIGKPDQERRVMDLNLSTAIESYGNMTKIWFGEQNFLVDRPFEDVWPWWEQAKQRCES
jgi:hypothetical protein